MEFFLLIVGIVCLLVGLAGAVLPLPGPPLSYAGLWAIQFSKYVQFSSEILIFFGVITFLVAVLDYLVPVWGTKKFGGSRWGVIGSAVGLVVGLFFGPMGLFIGAFTGAFIGEFLNNKDQNRAFRAATGSFIGLMAGIFVKVILCLAMLIYAVVLLIQNLSLTEFSN